MANRQTIYIHILIALLSAVVLYISIKPLIGIDEPSLIINSAISGLILSVLLLVLKIIIHYSGFSALLFQQKVINYGALAILFATCWLGIEFLITYTVFSEDEYRILTSTIPIRILIALMTYSCATLLYLRSDKVDTCDIDIEEYKEEESAIDEPAAEKLDILERIAVKNGTKIDVVLVSEIIYLQAEGDYVMIHSSKGKFLKEQTMKFFENSLPADKFVRVHRSNIVNIEHIAQIELYDKQSQLLKLKNGVNVKISLNGYKTLKTALGL